MAESSAWSANYLQTIMYGLALCALSLCIVAAHCCTLQSTREWPTIQAKFRVVCSCKYARCHTFWIVVANAP